MDFAGTEKEEGNLIAYFRLQIADFAGTEKEEGGFGSVEDADFKPGCGV